MRSSILSVALSAIAVLALTSCATTDAPKKSEPAPTPKNEAFADLQEQLRRILAESAGPAESGTPVTLGERAQRILAAMRKEFEKDYQNKLNTMFGAPEPLKDETVRLEALNEDGEVTRIPVEIKTRQLRSLSDPRVAPKAQRLLSEDDLALDLYSEIPQPIAAERTELNQRIYTGSAADAIAMEVRLIVQLKGGEWVEPLGAAKAANAIAIRGLDLTHGLRDNSNRTYDDTVYIVIETANAPTEVHEFRMTTESSNSKVGVGRLDSKQVYYRRGLHKGTDPAFRLVGNAASGTRRGRKGTFQITGANIHSAYTRRQIDSTTPLSPNVSLGCQVIAASKQEFERIFIALFDRKGIREFPYTIVDDTEVAELDRILREQSTRSILVRALPRA